MASRWIQRRHGGQVRDVRPEDVLGLPYLRVSSAKQERGYSPEAQRSEVAAYIRAKGWEPGPEYRDTDRGTRIERTDYQRLLSDARQLTAQGRPVAIVSVALDRFGRNLEEQLRSKRELTDLGAFLHFTRDGGELDDDRTIMRGWQAQNEVKKTSERVIGSKKHVADLGLPPSGPAAWGYRWRLPHTREEEEKYKIKKTVRRILEVDEAAAPYVREVFGRAASGESIGSLVRWAAALPSDARGGRLLPRPGIVRLLRNPVFVGRYDRDPNHTTPASILAQPKGRWPALVDDATWAQVQSRLDSHERRPRQASGKYLLTGLVWCPRCGCRMDGHTNGRSGRNRTGQHLTYRCISVLGGAGKTDTRCYYAATMNVVDQHLLDQVGRVLDAVGDSGLKPAVKRAWEQMKAVTKPTGARARELDAEIDRLEKRMARARDLFYDGSITKEELDADTARFRATRDERKSERAALAEQPSANLPPLDGVIADARGWSRLLLEASVTEQREVLTHLVERVMPVRVGYGKYEAEITWTKPLGERLHLLAFQLGTTADRRDGGNV